MAGGKKYAYVPFARMFLDEVLSAIWENWYVDPERNCELILPKYDNSSGHNVFVNADKALSDVEATATLLIIGHGCYWADQLSATAPSMSFRGEHNPEQLSVTSSQLADQLAKEGLPKDHKLIRLISCYGGGASEHEPRTSPQELVFACNLARHLHKLGYDRIAVGGYVGIIHARPKPSVGSNNADTRPRSTLIKLYRDAKTIEYVESRGAHIRWFNGGGQQIDKRDALLGTPIDDDAPADMDRYKFG